MDGVVSREKWKVIGAWISKFGHFLGGLLDLSAFWKALLVILEKTLMIEIWWEGGGNQDYLREEEARWTSSPPGPNDCVVIRRLVAVITDYWGGYSSCHTHAPTYISLFGHTLPYVTCHTPCHMWHFQAPCLCPTIVQAWLACFVTPWLQSCNSLVIIFKVWLIRKKEHLLQLLAKLLVRTGPEAWTSSGFVWIQNCPLILCNWVAVTDMFQFLNICSVHRAGSVFRTRSYCLRFHMHLFCFLQWVVSVVGSSDDTQYDDTRMIGVHWSWSLLDQDHDHSPIMIMVILYKTTKFSLGNQCSCPQSSATRIAIHFSKQNEVQFLFLEYSKLLSPAGLFSGSEVTANAGTEEWSRKSEMNSHGK